MIPSNQHFNSIHHVIIADDDEDDLDIFKAAFLEAIPDGNIITFCGGDLLLAHLSDNKNQQPSFIFLDINMPMKNGFECLKDIRNVMKLEIPVVMYSTSKQMEDVQTAESLGANFFLSKPSSFSVLIISIKYLLGLDQDIPVEDVSLVILGNRSYN